MKLEVVAESLSSKMKFIFSGLDILRSSAHLSDTLAPLLPFHCGLV